MTMLNQLFRVTRSVFRRPIFAGVAIVTVAVGIGSLTAILSIFDAVVWNPARDPRKLVVFSSGGRLDSISPPHFRALRKSSTAFREVAIFATRWADLTGNGEPLSVKTALVTAGLFEVLQKKALVGRLFSEGEDLPGGARVALISEGLWKRRFGARPSVPGETVSVNGTPCAILGVLPSSMKFPDDQVDLWLPINVEQPQAYDSIMGRVFYAIASLRPHIGINEAQFDFDSIMAALRRQNPKSRMGPAPQVTWYHEYLAGDARLTISLFMVGAVMVLLIVCVNVANLMLMRTEDRREEMAIRASLGAGRLRLAGRNLVEGLILYLPGSALGLLLAYWSVRSLEAWNPVALPQLERLNLNLRVLGAASATAFLTALATSAIPSLRAATASEGLSLRDARFGKAVGKKRRSSMVIVAESALALMLMIAAGLVAKSFYNVQRLDLGFNPERVLTLQLALPKSRYPAFPAVERFLEEVTTRVGGLAGVESVGAASSLPLTDVGRRHRFEAEADDGMAKPAWADSFIVTPDYFESLQIPVVQGRAFVKSDLSRPVPAVVIDERLANLLWPGEDPVGKRIRYGSRREQTPWSPVIGTVKSIRKYRIGTSLQIRTAPQGQVYHLMSARSRRTSINWFHLTIRSRGDPVQALGSVRQIIWSIDENLPASRAGTLEELVSAFSAQVRFNLVVLALMAGIAWILGAVGIYGIAAFTVSRRKREFAIRRALGLGRFQLMRMVLQSGLQDGLLGTVVGLTVVFGLNRFLANMLFGVSSIDATVYVLATATLLGTSLLACYFPARRAAMHDPAAVLRRD